MNQEKIGKFIAEKRKNQKLTQEQLAEELGITKNAVSKWERGISLMDVSLLKPLSKILNVSVIEILNGESITNENIHEKSEQILYETLNYSTTKIKKNKIIITLLIIIIAITSIILLDTFQAIIFKNSPIISWRTKDKIDDDSYIDKSFLINVYYCVKDKDIITVIPTFKNTNYNCRNE